jgi:hypothetical protein
MQRLESSSNTYQQRQDSTVCDKTAIQNYDAKNPE